MPVCEARQHVVCVCWPHNVILVCNTCRTQLQYVQVPFTVSSSLLDILPVLRHTCVCVCVCVEGVGVETGILVIPMRQGRFMCHRLKQSRATEHVWERKALTTQPSQSLCLQPYLILWSSVTDRLGGLVVKASASRAEGPGFESRLRRDFSGSSHTSDLKTGTPSGYPARRLAL